MGDSSSTEVLVLSAVSYGALLNLFAARWRDTDCLLEKRRNDFVALVLWVGLAVLTGLIAAGLGNTELSLEDWVVILLPWAAGTQNVLQLLASLLRQIEMWEWLNQSTYRVLPIAWMYRTMTRGESDDDGKWLRESGWDPRNPETIPQGMHTFNLLCNHSAGAACNSFRQSSTRQATMTHTVNEWLHVLQSATMRVATRTCAKGGCGKPGNLVLGVVSLLGVLVSLTVCFFVLGILMLTENTLFSILDYLRWLSHFRKEAPRSNDQHQENESFAPIVRYESVQLGQGELKILYETQKNFRSSRSDDSHSSGPALRDCAMTAIATVAGLLQNAFREAYLVTPTYKEAISGRRVLRPLYFSLGLDLDVMIKSVRHVLELRYGSGLLSLANRIPASGTIEAALHDNIEALLTIAFFLTPRVLYAVSAKVAALEDRTLKRASQRLTDPQRQRLAEIVAIDTRNFVVWLLWLEIVHCLVNDPKLGRVWPNAATAPTADKEENVTSMPRIEDVLEEVSSSGLLSTDHEIEGLYVMASFLSRCRYCGDTGYDLADTRDDVLDEVLGLAPSARRRGEIESRFRQLSSTLRTHTGRCLLTWAEIEHSEVRLLFPNKEAWYRGEDADLLFTWSGNMQPQACRISPERTPCDQRMEGGQSWMPPRQQPRPGKVLERTAMMLPPLDESSTGSGSLKDDTN